jgi:hypothetical protein
MEPTEEFLAMTTFSGSRFPLPLPWRYAPAGIVIIPGDLDVLQQHFGEPHLTAPEEGVGTFDYWGFELPCGLQIGIKRSHDANAAAATSNRIEPGHIVRHLPFAREEVSLVDHGCLQFDIEFIAKHFPERQAELEALRHFQVYRIDDNGNIFTVGEPTSEGDAHCLAAELEARGHKQMYYVRRVGRSEAL